MAEQPFDPRKSRTISHHGILEDGSVIELCHAQYGYDGRTCGLAKGHDDPDHHCAGDFHWLHHEEFIAAAGTGDLTSDLWETWDEPIDRLNTPKEPGVAPHTINRIGLMNAPGDSETTEQ